MPVRVPRTPSPTFTGPRQPQALRTYGRKFGNGEKRPEKYLIPPDADGSVHSLVDTFELPGLAHRGKENVVLRGRPSAAKWTTPEEVCICSDNLSRKMHGLVSKAVHAVRPGVDCSKSFTIVGLVSRAKGGIVVSHVPGVVIPVGIEVVFEMQWHIHMQTTEREFPPLKVVAIDKAGKELRDEVVDPVAWYRARTPRPARLGATEPVSPIDALGPQESSPPAPLPVRFPPLSAARGGHRPRELHTSISRDGGGGRKEGRGALPKKRRRRVLEDEEDDEENARNVKGVAHGDDVDNAGTHAHAAAAIVAAVWPTASCPAAQRDVGPARNDSSDPCGPSCTARARRQPSDGIGAGRARAFLRRSTSVPSAAGADGPVSAAEAEVYRPVDALEHSPPASPGREEDIFCRDDEDSAPAHRSLPPSPEPIATNAAAAAAELPTSLCRPTAVSAVGPPPPPLAAGPPARAPAPRGASPPTPIPGQTVEPRLPGRTAPAPPGLAPPVAEDNGALARLLAFAAEIDAHDEEVRKAAAPRLCFEQIENYGDARVQEMNGDFHANDKRIGRFPPTGPVHREFRLHVVSRDETPIGYVLHSGSPRDSERLPEVHHVYIVPRQRRRGVGKAIVQCAERRLSSARALPTDVGNAPSRFRWWVSTYAHRCFAFCVNSPNAGMHKLLLRSGATKVTSSQAWPARTARTRSHAGAGHPCAPRCERPLRSSAAATRTTSTPLPTGVLSSAQMRRDGPLAGQDPDVNCVQRIAASGRGRGVGWTTSPDTRPGGGAAAGCVGGGRHSESGWSLPWHPVRAMPPHPHPPARGRQLKSPVRQRSIEINWC